MVVIVITMTILMTVMTVVMVMMEMTVRMVVMVVMVVMSMMNMSQQDTRSAELCRSVVPAILCTKSRHCDVFYFHSHFLKLGLFEILVYGYN